MPPGYNLYRVWFEKLSNGVFLFVATGFGDADEQAKAYAIKCLESKHWTVVKIVLAANGCDIIGTIAPAKETP
jgi:hypothetical protein